MQWPAILESGYLWRKAKKLLRNESGGVKAYSKLMKAKYVSSARRS